MGYTIQQTGEHIEYIQLEAKAKSLTCSMCSLPALPRASTQTCVNIYLNLYVRGANTCVYIPVFVSAAPIPFRRAEEATSRRHGPHYFTSKQLVSQDFRSPYLHHQHGAAFHCEKLSPPSPRKKTPFLYNHPLYVAPHPTHTRTEVHTLAYTPTTFVALSYISYWDVPALSAKCSVPKSLVFVV